MRPSSVIQLLPVSAEVEALVKPCEFENSLPAENLQEAAVALSPELLSQLLASGTVHASQLRPLNAQTKQQIHQQCLQQCQGKRCDDCIFQKQCQCFAKEDHE